MLGPSFTKAVLRRKSTGLVVRKPTAKSALWPQVSYLSGERGILLWLSDNLWSLYPRAGAVGSSKSDNGLRGFCKVHGMIIIKTTAKPLSSSDETTFLSVSLPRE